MKIPVTLIKAALMAGLFLVFSGLESAGDTIKIGILHSLSGTMAISEKALKETALMTIAEINESGGVLGRKLEAVVADPASDCTLFAEKARQLLTQEKVAVVFGCWTSASRKAVLPVFRELNGLLFYPVQYEGEELEKNVFYTGAVPNQQALPALEYLMSLDGGQARRFVMIGTDYVYPRTTHRILKAVLKSKGIPDSDVIEEYFPFGHADYQASVARIRRFTSEGFKTAVISTINGDSNIFFYKALADAGLKAAEIPVMAFSVGEEELRSMNVHPLVGHLASWNYFMSLKTPENERFIRLFRTWARHRNLPNAGSLVTNDPMEATYIGLHLWKQAVERAGSIEVDQVIAAMGGQRFKAPSGFTVKMDEKNHHLHKPVFIGAIQPDAQFRLVWKLASPLKAAPWSYYLPGNETKKDEPKDRK